MKTGFTLIELLIVIAIIGILGVVVFESLQRTGTAEIRCKERCLSSGASVWTYGLEGCACGGWTK